MLQEKVEPKMARAICHAGIRLWPTLAIVIATAFPAHAQDTPPNLTAWSDLDAVVANAYAGIANAAVFYPPGAYHFTIGGTYCTFDTGGEVAAITNLCACGTQFGIPVWQVSVVETQLTTRVWLYEGAGGAPFYTNQNAASYDPTQWVQRAYSHNAPDYLTGDDLTQWFADRDRSRFGFGFTFVNANDWPTLQALLAAPMDNPPPGTWSPPFPSDTNHLSFVGIRSSTTTPNTMDLWLYSPAAYPMAVVMSSNLTAKLWSLYGSFAAVPAFNLYSVPCNMSEAFFELGSVDVDSDGDGLPDFIESNVTGADPYKWDSAGTSLGDFARMFVFGLSTTNRDSNGDGMDDDEAILAGLDPNAPNTVAGAASIRYYYDADDRVSATFSGSSAGAAVYTVSPAGNPATTTERSAP